MKKILFLHTGSEMYGADKVMLDLIKNVSNDIMRVLVLSSFLIFLNRIVHIEKFAYNNFI